MPGGGTEISQAAIMLCVACDGENHMLRLHHTDCMRYAAGPSVRRACATVADCCHYRTASRHGLAWRTWAFSNKVMLEYGLFGQSGKVSQRSEPS